MTNSSEARTEKISQPRTEVFNYSPDELLQAASEFRAIIDSTFLRGADFVHRAYIRDGFSLDEDKPIGRRNVLTLQHCVDLEDGSRVVTKIESIENSDFTRESNCKIEIVAWGSEADPGVKDSHTYTLGDEGIVRRYDITADEWRTQLDADVSPIPGGERLEFERSVGLNDFPVGIDEVRRIEALLSS